MSDCLLTGTFWRSLTFVFSYCKYLGATSKTLMNKSSFQMSFGCVCTTILGAWGLGDKKVHNEKHFLHVASQQYLHACHTPYNIGQ